MIITFFDVKNKQIIQDFSLYLRLFSKWLFSICKFVDSAQTNIAFAAHLSQIQALINFENIRKNMQY